MRLRWFAFVVGVFVAFVPTYAFALNDAYGSRQWGLERVRAEKAWSTGRGAGATIAIVDSGVDLKHPDLVGSFVPGYDFVDDDAVPMDEESEAEDYNEGHGTHVAGIAAARANNSIGIAGVAPEAKIMPIRVINERGSAQADDLEDGVRWAVDHGADVLNLSLAAGVVIEGLSGGSMTDLVNYAWSNGVVPVVSAGNGGLFRTDSSDAKTLVVTATTTDDERASYATSVGFADWGIAAPGGDSSDGDASKIISTHWSAKQGSGYGWGMGTSQAAPHVSAAAAVLRGLGLDAQETVDRLLATADDIGSSGEDFTFGHGLVDVAAAVKGLTPATDPKVAAPRSTPPPEDEGNGAARAPPPTGGSSEAQAKRPEQPPAADSARTEAPSLASPRARVVASDEMSERSAIANVVVGAILLAAAGALVTYGSVRRLRARR